ncbi:unnamed protein product [Brugia pahangi]|uniref:CUB domain-containing protein n=1 Tax=Brugia pahangi TaxID=6280 RepID=A0A0N4TIY4_BRUPA|nr:unnamed protein product [Brugia pahangi]
MISFDRKQSYYSRKGGADVLWSLFNGNANSKDLSLPPCTARALNIYVDIDMLSKAKTSKRSINRTKCSLMDKAIYFQR